MYSVMCLQLISASFTTVFTAIHSCNVVASLCVSVILPYVFKTLQAKCLIVFFFFKTLVKVRMYKDTHLRSYFFYRE